MKWVSLVSLFILSLHCNALVFKPTSGFYLPEPIEEVTMRYKCINNLIVLPVVINDSITVNLILDTGTRNIVLFGKTFQNMFEFVPNKSIQFSGMGSGKPVLGKLSLNNKVELTSLIGERIPIVVVNNKNVFLHNPKIDGIIGYEIFQKFEVEINPREKLVTFRSPLLESVPDGFTKVSIDIDKTIPIIDSKISFEDGTSINTNLMIDTGSELHLLIQTTDQSLINSGYPELIGKGISGKIEGIKTIAQKINLTDIHFYDQPTGIIQSPWHNYGSIGMGILKDYIVIINYTGLYACLKKLKT